MFTKKEKIIEYFSLYNFSKTSTFYKGVNRVEANSILRLDINKSMKISTKKVKKRNQFQGSNTYFIYIFKISINFNKSKKSGVILSGGIDSASVACSIRDNYKESQLLTYSMDYDADNYPYYKKSSEEKYQDIIKDKIHSIRIIRDRVTGLSKCFGFIQFEDRKSATEVFKRKEKKVLKDLTSFSLERNF